MCVFYAVDTVAFFFLNKYVCINDIYFSIYRSINNTCIFACNTLNGKLKFFTRNKYFKRWKLKFSSQVLI